MNSYEAYCMFHGHITYGETGDELRCVRCGKQLDGMGLDPSLSTRKDEV